MYENELVNHKKTPKRRMENSRGSRFTTIFSVSIFLVKLSPFKLAFGVDAEADSSASVFTFPSLLIEVPSLSEFNDILAPGFSSSRFPSIFYRKMFTYTRVLCVDEWIDMLVKERRWEKNMD